jgi:hypothetical protein
MGHHGFGQEPQPLLRPGLTRIGADSAQAGEDSDDIPIEDGSGLIKGDAADGTGGVGANPGQLQECLQRAGELALVVSLDCAGGGLKIPRAAIITKAFPELEHCVRMSPCQGTECWEALEPAFPEGHDGFDAGLLEHDL